MSIKTEPHINKELLLINRFYSPQHSDEMLHTLIEDVQWSADYYMAFERRIDIPRQQAWFADPGIRYSYSNNLLETQSWLPLLSRIRREVESALRHRFNSVLLTYYRNGHDSVSWHADDEAELGTQPWIASLSLGASRDFHFRDRQNHAVEHLTLHNGDLLLMQPGFQHHYEHCVPEQVEVSGPRINLTFRQVVFPADEDYIQET